MTIEAVIFDFGGVITSSPFDAFNRFEAEHGLPHNFIRQVNATQPHDNAWAKFERAEIGASEFDALFATEADLLGQKIGGHAVLALLSGDIRPRMVAALDTLKSAGFTIACITNNVPTGQGAGMAPNAAKATEIDQIMKRFDHVIQSSKVGIRKPDPQIYAMMCAALAIPPDRCAYLDDLGINCKPAAEMGMTAIKVMNEDQALDDLAKAVNLQLS